MSVSSPGTVVYNTLFWVFPSGTQHNRDLHGHLIEHWSGHPICTFFDMICPSDKVRRAIIFYPLFVDFTVDDLRFTGFIANANHSLIDALVMEMHGHVFNRCNCLVLRFCYLLSVSRVFVE